MGLYARCRRRDPAGSGTNKRGRKNIVCFVGSEEEEEEEEEAPFWRIVIL